MLILSRIILFVLCITTVSSWADTQSDINQSSESISDQLPLFTNSADASQYDTIESTYVQFNIPSEHSAQFSVLRSLGRMAQVAQQRYYSLLNWKQMNRRPRDTFIPKYNRRSHFGGWINSTKDETCFNTRAKVLIRDSNKEVTFDSENKCNVLAGAWNDDYTAQTYTKREEIQIDHLVALKNAYVSGAYNWNFKARCLYANYMGYDFHLKSVNSTENMRKSDKSPQKYMPPNSEYSCQFLRSWLSVKFLWNLKMTTDEAVAISQLLKANKCSPSSFRISSYEILKQTAYANEHLDLCAAITPPPLN